MAELDKVCNTLVKRIREWYGYYYPEFEHEIQDNESLSSPPSKKQHVAFADELAVGVEETPLLSLLLSKAQLGQRTQMQGLPTTVP